MRVGRVTLAPPETGELWRRARSRPVAAESVRRARSYSCYQMVILTVKLARDSIAKIITPWKGRSKQERLIGNMRMPGMDGLEYANVSRNLLYS